MNKRRTQKRKKERHAKNRRRKHSLSSKTRAPRKSLKSESTLKRILLLSRRFSKKRRPELPHEEFTKSPNKTDNLSQSVSDTALHGSTTQSPFPHRKSTFFEWVRPSVQKSEPPLILVDGATEPKITSALVPLEKTKLLLQDAPLSKQALRESMEAFLLNQRSENTRRAYQKDLKRFFSYLLMLENEKGTSPPFNRATVIAYKEMLLSEGLEHTSVDRHLATLRSFFRWLREDELIQNNPMDGVKFLKPKRISSTIGFSDEEVLKVLALPDLHTRVGAQHYAILMVLFYCGLRRSELCSLRTSQLSKEREKWVFRLKGKGNKERFVVLTNPVWNAIRYLFRITGRTFEVDDFIFTPIKKNRKLGDSKRQKAFDPSMIFYIVRKYAKMAGILSKVSPHSCRATAISNARDHHVPDRAIQEFAGWSSPDMITRYDKRKTAVEDSASLAIKYGEEGQERIQSYHFEIHPSSNPSPSLSTEATGNDIRTRVSDTTASLVDSDSE